MMGRVSATVWLTHVFLMELYVSEKEDTSDCDTQTQHLKKNRAYSQSYSVLLFLSHICLPVQDQQRVLLLKQKTKKQGEMVFYSSNFCPGYRLHRDVTSQMTKKVFKK